MKNLQERPSHGGDVYSKREMKFADHIVDFSANINPLGMPPEVKAALINHIDSYECYPDPHCRELKNAIALLENTEPQNILCGNGAADLIFRLALACKPKKALLLAPTFSEYEQALKTVDCEITYYLLDEKDGFSVDERILAAISQELDILFICNPNNPTGLAVGRGLMLKIADKCKECHVNLVVDECFVDFLMEEKAVRISSETDHYDNLIIVKAFTKIYAMAGIRLGYLLCHNQDILRAIERVSQAWSVSTVAAKCGVAAASQTDYVQKTKLLTRENRIFLMDNLHALGIKTYASKANYIFFYCEDFLLQQKLEQYGILIRDCQNYCHLAKGFFRIAVKAQADNRYFVECLKKVILEQCP